jgi:Zn-dependent peptidase ImmA (M78 family)
MRVNYIAPTEIERRANAVIQEYEKRYGTIPIPVPIELIAENIVDLVLEWRKIPESTGEVIFAGLAPAQRKVIFNERRKKDYDDNGGLYNTVLAHEVGHWSLHVDAADLGLQSLLPGTGIASQFLLRSTGPTKPIEWQAHAFMGYLLMPYRLLRNYIETEDLCDWSTLYYLRDKFDVTISALVIRLTKMKLIYVDDKRIYPSEAVAKGQARLI